MKREPSRCLSFLPRFLKWFTILALKSAFLPIESTISATPLLANAAFSSRSSIPKSSQACSLGIVLWVRAPDKNFQYLIFAAAPYENIAFKIPNKEIDKGEGRFITSWNTTTKVFQLRMFFKTDEQSEAEKKRREASHTAPSLRIEYYGRLYVCLIKNRIWIVWNWGAVRSLRSLSLCWGEWMHGMDSLHRVSPLLVLGVLPLNVLVVVVAPLLLVVVAPQLSAPLLPVLTPLLPLFVQALAFDAP